ncbi:MAG: sensory rhodopsin transducer [Dehalococcoidia bacterium]
MATAGGIGRTAWAIAEGHIPGRSNGPHPELTSHEAVCILNASDEGARIELTVYYTDREPVRYDLTVPARRTKHVRFNDLTEPESIPLDTDFASVVRSSVPVVVQHTRLDSRQAENALLSTMAFPADE